MKTKSNSRTMYIFLGVFVAAVLGLFVLMHLTTRSLEEQMSYQEYESTEEKQTAKADQVQDVSANQKNVVKNEITRPEKEQKLNQEEETEKTKKPETYPRIESSKNTTDDWMFEGGEEIEAKIDSHSKNELTKPSE
ncbi:hypothetical protein GF312_02665 [Candidatus Poribacteria bacterium]|nr:hypothetical protein [Candidatus Poribacteria bacterium]